MSTTSKTTNTTNTTTTKNSEECSNTISSTISCMDYNRKRALLSMALAMSMHYFGYEFVRNSILSLFTSKQVGFDDSHLSNQENISSDHRHHLSSASYMSLAMACSSPFSMFLLIFVYGKVFNRHGPKVALKHNTLLCATVFLLSSTLLYFSSEINSISENIFHSSHLSNTFLKNILCNSPSISKPIIFCLFTFQNSYVGLLSSQHWAFIGSVLTPEEGTLLFPPIAGVGSIASTVAAALVSYMVDFIGLYGLLILGGFSLLLGTYFGNLAYQIAEKHGFDPSDQVKEKKQKNNASKTNIHTTTNISSNAKESSTKKKDVTGTRHFIQHTITLFKRVPILSALFLEVIACGFLSSLLNFMFVMILKESILDDSLRAGYSGNFYALTNATSALLQFGPLSVLMNTIGIGWLWILMPATLLCFTVYPWFIGGDQPTLFVITLSYFILKTIEYSLHAVVTEMTFVSLDYESRYMGKEIVGVLGCRIGRSGVSLALAVVTSFYGDLKSKSLSYFAILLALLWLLCGLQVSRFVCAPTTCSNKKASFNQNHKTKVY